MHISITFRHKVVYIPSHPCINLHSEHLALHGILKPMTSTINANVGQHHVSDALHTCCLPQSRPEIPAGSRVQQKATHSCRPPSPDLCTNLCMKGNIILPAARHANHPRYVDKSNSRVWLAHSPILAFALCRSSIRPAVLCWRDLSSPSSTPGIPQQLVTCPTTTTVTHATEALLPPIMPLHDCQLQFHTNFSAGFFFFGCLLYFLLLPVVFF